MVRTDCSDRFWSKVDKSGDCWKWIAAKDDGGYGMSDSAIGRIINGNTWL